MTVARVTQTEAEIILVPDPKAVVSQVVAEVIYSAAATARPTQIAAEVITSENGGDKLVHGSGGV